MRHLIPLALLAVMSGAQARFEQLQARSAADECCPCSVDTGKNIDGSNSATADTKTVYISNGVRLDTLPTLTVTVDHTVTKKGPTVYVTEPSNPEQATKKTRGGQKQHSTAGSHQDEVNGASSVRQDTKTQHTAQPNPHLPGSVDKNDGTKGGDDGKQGDRADTDKPGKGNKPNADPDSGNAAKDNDKPAASSKHGAHPDGSKTAAHKPGDEPSNTSSGNHPAQTNAEGDKEHSSHDDKETEDDDEDEEDDDEEDEDADNEDPDNDDEDEEAVKSDRKPSGNGGPKSDRLPATPRPDPPVRTLTVDNGRVVTVTVDSGDRARVTAAPETRTISVNRYRTITRTVSDSDGDDGDNIEIIIININTGRRTCKTKSGKRCQSNGTQVKDNKDAEDKDDVQCKPGDEPVSTKTVFNTVYATLEPKPRPTDSEAEVQSGSLAAGNNSTNSMGLNSTASASLAFNGTTLPTDQPVLNGTSWNGTATVGAAQPSGSGSPNGRRARSPLFRKW